jgi:hypothetical protein
MHVAVLLQFCCRCYIVSARVCVYMFRLSCILIKPYTHTTHIHSSLRIFPLLNYETKAVLLQLCYIHVASLLNLCCLCFFSTMSSVEMCSLQDTSVCGLKPLVYETLSY